MADDIPTTTATFRALKSLPLPWLLLLGGGLLGGGGLAGGSFLGGGVDQDVGPELVEIKVQLVLLLEKVEDLDDGLADIKQALAVADARHGRSMSSPSPDPR